MIAFANTAIWINRQIFDTDNFTNTAVTSITSESSRKALGARITDEALQDTPVVKNIAGDRVSGLISGLLGTDLANSLLVASVSKLQVYVTSSDQQDVDIDLTQLKGILTKVVALGDIEQTIKVDPNNIPDKIVIIEAKNVPDLYGYGVAMSWLAPLAALVAIGLLARPYFRDRKSYLKIMTVQGLSLIVVGLISLLTGPLLRPIALESVTNANGRIVVGNLYDAFIKTFDAQTAIIVYFGLAVCLAAALVSVYRRLKAARLRHV